MTDLKKKEKTYPTEALKTSTNVTHNAKDEQYDKTPTLYIYATKHGCNMAEKMHCTHRNTREHIYCKGLSVF